MGQEAIIASDGLNRVPFGTAKAIRLAQRVRARSLEAETPGKRESCSQTDSLEHVCFRVKQTCSSRGTVTRRALVVDCSIADEMAYMPFGI